MKKLITSIGFFALKQAIVSVSHFNDQVKEELKTWSDGFTILLRNIDLKEAGIKQDQLEKIAELSLNDGAMIANPKEIDKYQALEILQNAF